MTKLFTSYSRNITDILPFHACIILIILCRQEIILSCLVCLISRGSQRLLPTGMHNVELKHFNDFSRMKYIMFCYTVHYFEGMNRLVQGLDLPHGL